MIRLVSAADAVALDELCDRLRLEGALHRCSTFARLGPDVVERLTTVGDRGGCGLVATVSATRLDRPRVVGGAGYELLADGNGELDLVVAPEWRWWLQRLLVHSILEAAHRRGVPNIEVEVLLTNQALLGFARARGCAFTRSERQWSLRAVMGTAGRTPTWPRPHDRPRVLVESPVVTGSFDPARVPPDWQVLVCPGPDERDCAAIDGHTCPLAMAADAVVIVPRAGDRRWSDLSAAHRRLHPDVPVFVEPPPVASGAARARLVDEAARAHRGRRVDPRADLPSRE